MALQYLVQTNAQRKLGGLEYKGDIKAYLTEFRALKIYAKCMGESLQEKINLAMPQAIIDMRFAHHMGEFVDDEHFLTATYEAGLHVEQRKALEELRSGKKEKEGPKPGKDSGKSRKGQGEKEDPKQAEKAGSGGKARRPEFGQAGHRGTKEEALAGVPAREQKEYGASRDGCWRCKRTGHKTFECYAGTTYVGTALPAAPWKGASSAIRKRALEEAEDAPTAKQGRTTHIKTEDEEMREAAAAWTKDQQETGVCAQDTNDSDF